LIHFYKRVSNVYLHKILRRQKKPTLPISTSLSSLTEKNKKKFKICFTVD